MQFVAAGIALGVGVLAGIAAGREVADVFGDPRWLPWAVGGGISLAVAAILYLPLLRPVADVLSDRLSATHQRFRATRTGTGLDDVPMRLERPSGFHDTTK